MIENPSDDAYGRNPGELEGLSDSNGSFDGSRVRRLMRAFGIIGLLAAIDLLSDRGSGIDFGHLAIEGTIVLLSAGGVFALWRMLVRTRHEVETLTGALAVRTAEAERWRGETRGLLDGLGAAIESQFQRWSLTGAEREVGLLLVKGLSLKEVAQIRDTSERTVRQQAQSVYRKAGVAGRAELSAFFLEDLLLPATADLGGDDLRRLHC